MSKQNPEGQVRVSKKAAEGRGVGNGGHGCRKVRGVSKRFGIWYNYLTVKTYFIQIYYLQCLPKKKTSGNKPNICMTFVKKKNYKIKWVSIKEDLINQRNKAN